MTDAEIRRRIQWQLDASASLNDGHGPVVGQGVASVFRQHGFHTGYVETKPLPTE